MMRNASAERDRADANVTKEHVPTFVRGFQVAAAGEGWQGPINAPRAAVGKLFNGWGQARSRATADRALRVPTFPFGKQPFWK